jgi:hypothetical protein
MRFVEQLTRAQRRLDLFALEARVGDRGQLVMAHASGEMRPVEALRLARWILRTFGARR